jgi:type I restriction enzyme R subunit
MEALILSNADMDSFLRVYTFLSQIFDYENTDIEKRFLLSQSLYSFLRSNLRQLHYTIFNDA